MSFNEMLFFCLGNFVDIVYYGIRFLEVSLNFAKKFMEHYLHDIKLF